MFHNKDLWLSLRNNAVYFVIHLFMILVELAFAVLLTSKLRAAKFYKTMVFLPYIINGVAISYAFSYFFSPINGAFNGILTALHLESLIRNWLSDEENCKLRIGICICLEIQRIPCDPVHGSPAVHPYGHSGGSKDRRRKYRTDFQIHTDSCNHADGGLRIVRQYPRSIAGIRHSFRYDGRWSGYASSTFTLYTIKTAFTFSNFDWRQPWQWRSC